MGVSIGGVESKAVAKLAGDAATEKAGSFKDEVSDAVSRQAAPEGAPKGGTPDAGTPRPPLLIAKDWGTTEALYCNRTRDENIYVFKDVYDENGNPTGINGTAVPPGACGTGDFLLTDLNGDDKLNLGGQNREFVKQPNAILGGFWNVIEDPNGKSSLQAGNNAAVEELMIGTGIHGRDLYTPKTLGEMNRIMGGDKPVLIEGRPVSGMSETPITPRR